jgi:phosphonate transport system substrate-binding protein
VARKLGSGPDTQGKVVIVPTPLQMAKLLEEKKIDFYLESPYPTYLINKQGAAVLLLRRWKSGMAEYRGLIFSKKDSETNRLEQLRGKMIAFEDPGSTSGYFLPKVLLLKKGFMLPEKSRPDAKVGPKEIGYIFASTDVNVVNSVLSKRVAAGAFSDDDYGALDGSRKADIIILAQTDLFPHLSPNRSVSSPPCFSPQGFGSDGEEPPEGDSAFHASRRRRPKHRAANRQYNEIRSPTRRGRDGSAKAG